MNAVPAASFVQAGRSDRISFAQPLSEGEMVAVAPFVPATPAGPSAVHAEPIQGGANPVIAGIVPPDRLALAMNGGAAQVLTSPPLPVTDLQPANAAGAGTTSSLWLGGQVFDEQLLRQLQLAMPRPPALGAARRIMLVATDDATERDIGMAQEAAMKLAELLGKGGRVMLVQCPLPEALVTDDDMAAAPLGFTDLLCGEATFADVISRYPGRRLHWIATGSGPAEELAEDPEALEVALSALSHAYDHILIFVPGRAIEVVGAVLAPRVDNAIVLSGTDTGDIASNAMAQRVRALAPGRTIVASLDTAHARSSGAAA